MIEDQDTKKLVKKVITRSKVKDESKCLRKNQNKQKKSQFDLDDLSEDVIVSIVGYMSLMSRLINCRISKKFNNACKHWWEKETSFPFTDRFPGNNLNVNKDRYLISSNEPVISLAIKEKSPIIEKLSINLIPAIIKCSQLRNLEIIFTHSPFWFHSNFMLSHLGSRLASSCPLIKSVTLINANLDIISDYLSIRGSDNKLELLEIRCSQNEQIDFDQFVKLIPILSKHAIRLTSLAISLPPGLSDKEKTFTTAIKKNFITIGSRLKQLWSPKFYYFRPGDNLSLLGFDQNLNGRLGSSMSKISADCVNITTITGYVHPTKSNFAAFKNFQFLVELHLSNFKSVADYDQFVAYLILAGKQLTRLYLRDLIEVSPDFWHNLSSNCVNLTTLSLKHVHSLNLSTRELCDCLINLSRLSYLELWHVNPHFKKGEMFLILNKSVLDSISVLGKLSLIQSWKSQFEEFSSNPDNKKRNITFQSFVSSS